MAQPLVCALDYSMNTQQAALANRLWPALGGCGLRGRQVEEVLQGFVDIRRVDEVPYIERHEQVANSAPPIRVNLCATSAKMTMRARLVGQQAHVADVPHRSKYKEHRRA